MPDADQRPPSFDVVVPLAMYSLEALKRTAYRLMARATVTYQLSDTEARCTLSPVAPQEDLLVLERDFQRELLDQDLRLLIEVQTAPMRDAILGLTFSRTGLQE